MTAPPPKAVPEAVEPAGVVSASVAKVLDEHAELRVLLARLREVRAPLVTAGLLDRLLALLEGHFAREEESGGLMQMMGGTAAQRDDEVRRLIAEHSELLAFVRDLIGQLSLQGGRLQIGLEGEVAALVRRLEDHDARESELLDNLLTRERGIGIARAGPEGSGLAARRCHAPATVQEGSGALEVNLRRTAVDVVIPTEHKVLLEITAPLYGLQEDTRKLLREIHHRYVGWPQTLDELHRRAMGDLAHYLADERAGDAVRVFCSLYAKAIEEAVPVGLRETALRDSLYYLEKVIEDSGPRLEDVLPAVGEALDRLAPLLVRTPSFAMVSSPRIRRVVEALLAVGSEAAAGTRQRGLDVLAAVHRSVFTRWLSGEDPAVWWREQSGARVDEPPPEPVAAISHARLREHLGDLDRLTAGGIAGAANVRALLALPDNAAIERGYLAAAACLEPAAEQTWQKQLAGIHWLLRVLGVSELSGVHDQALAEVSHAYLDVLRDVERSGLERVVRETFAVLRHGPLASSSAAFHLIARIGSELLVADDPEWTRLLVREMLECDFPPPEFSGFTDEWQARVNPGHLRGIRTYLTLIERDPERARPLLAALVLHLKIGGVFIADTDLFQKDVSSLLNCDIAPVYHEVKQLLRVLPVYFSEVGAEGELREASTHIDEIAGRKDPLCHFLRKQCHVESNPRLIDFVEAIGHFWATGDRRPLGDYVPADLYERLDIGSEVFRGVHRIVSELADGGGASAFFSLDPAALAGRVVDRGGDEVDDEKARLLLRLRHLIGSKYELRHDDLLERLAAFHRFPPAELAALGAALADGRDEAALELLLEVLEHLKEIISSPERTEAVEDIYYKRHIAVGIPSLYGRYREPKFEAVGLTFRAESLAKVLIERMIADARLEYVARSTLTRVSSWLRLLLRALRIDGFRARGLAAGSAMLEQALGSEGISVDQYVNIFQSISHSIQQLIRTRFLDVYEDVVERLLGRMFDCGALPADAGSDRQETVLKVSETFLREQISESFGLQSLDVLVGRVLRALVQGREKLDRTTLNLLMTYDTERCCVAIDREEGPFDTTICLGNKGYLIKRLAHYGFPVPDGFVFTTELFRCRTAILACEELRQEVAEQTRRQVARLEGCTGLRFGDPHQPLLLSVRSGAAMSMPGMLDTFLNVGINEEIAAGFAAWGPSPWAAWDAYRRFLQLWGMSHGIGRNLFDALMREAKHEYLVAKKSNLPAESMREVALRYRALLADHGVRVVEEPFEQLDACIDLVLRSWHGEKARLYRSEMQIAEEWGTAVIVQRMVYGNLYECSGTGVVLTCDPRRVSSDVQLYGDFIVQGQGDDVVSGLVDTFPISERQRRSEAKGVEVSLEKDFPAVYGAMTRHARALRFEHGMFHQEIEFTFESERPEDLYILQTRDAVLTQTSPVSTFVPGEALERAKVATGIGIGRGVLSGRVAHTGHDIAGLRRRFPDDPIILLRPDTVPDDIPLILQADGMVTKTGGATSHAAVAAQRLGRTCVVGCRLLRVFEEEGRSEVAGHRIETGDFLSINGIDGAVYLGRHPATTVQGARRVENPDEGRKG